MKRGPFALACILIIFSAFMGACSEKEQESVQASAPAAVEPTSVPQAPEPEPTPEPSYTPTSEIKAAGGEVAQAAPTELSAPEPVTEYVLPPEDLVLPDDAEVLTLVFIRESDFTVIEEEVTDISACLLNREHLSRCHADKAREVHPNSTFWRPDACMWACTTKLHKEVTYLAHDM